MEREFKDSGIEWIGRIPKEWKTCRLKDCANLVLGKMLMSTPPSGQSDKYTLEHYLKSKNIGWLELLLDNGVDEMWFSEEEKKNYLLNDGDIVMNEGGDIGKISIWHEQSYPCYIQNSVHKIVPQKTVHNVFLQYALYLASFKGYLQSIVNQISIAHLTKEKLQNTPIIFPPLPEQERIADYLDKKCSEIDKLIALQEQMIAQLTDYKQSVITEAVTKGLNSDAQLVPSDIDWIGDVPEEWMVSKAKYFVTINNGSDPKREGNIPVYGSGATSFKTCGEYKEGPTVLIGRKGATLHIPHFIEGKYWNVDTAFDVKTKGNMDLKYYFYLAICFDYKYYISQTTLPGMAQSSYYNMSIPIPPLPEQRSIATYLDSKCSEIDSLIAIKQQKIETLKDYKKSVIYEAVTGKTVIGGARADLQSDRYEYKDF